MPTPHYGIAALNTSYILLGIAGHVAEIDVTRFVQNNPPWNWASQEEKPLNLVGML